MFVNIKNFINKHDNFFVALVIIVISIGIIVVKPVNTGDEIWNFNNAYKYFYGYKMYKDINVIIPPMFFYITNIIFSLFSANILVFKMMGLCICVCLNLLIYNILKTIGVKKQLSLVFLMLIQEVVNNIYYESANYNSLVFVFALIGIIIILKNKEKSIWLWQGIITYLIIFTKHNIGIFYFLGIVIIELLLNGYNKKGIKEIIKYALTTFILSCINLLVIYLQGILPDFISFVVLGINEFASNFYIGLDGIIIAFLNIATLCAILFLKKKNVFSEEEQKNLLIIQTMSLVLMIVIYPIANTYHISLVSCFLGINICYILYILIFRDIYIEKLLIALLIIFLVKDVIYSMNYLNKWIQYAKLDLEYNNPYYGGVIEKKVEENIALVDNYILDEKEKGNDVIIMSQHAAIYMIPLKKNNGIFDLPFLGNMGKDGEKGLIDKISKLKNTKILIVKDDLFWQESEKANEYVKSNFIKVGEIADFEIYE